MGIFDNLDQADVFEKSPYFQAGRYIVQLDAVKFLNGHNGETFVVEGTILGSQSEHPEAPTVGTRAAQVWKASGTQQKIDMGRANWLGFLCSAYAVAKDDYTGEQWKAISADVLDNNSLAGTILYLECHMTSTRSGGEFTVHSWRGAPTAEQYAGLGLAVPA